METMIHFLEDKADLGDEAKGILEAKVAVFQGNPGMKIVITGYASQPGTDAHNLALGLRRAEAAKAYLVSRGVDSNRIEISTKGEGELLVEGPEVNDPNLAANVANRRGQFRVLIADPYLVTP